MVAPKSTISNWMMEFERWAPHFKVVNLNPVAEVRDEILDKMRREKFDVCVTTYSAVTICCPQLRTFKWHYAVFDEAHKLKNSESEVMFNSRRIPAKRRLLLTGTPLMNNISELWSLLNFLMPKLFVSSEEFNEWFNFDSNTNKKNAEMNKEQKMIVIECLHRVMRPFMLRRTKKDLETKLPNKIEINVSINLTDLQIKLYQEFLLGTNGIRLN